MGTSRVLRTGLVLTVAALVACDETGGSLDATGGSPEVGTSSILVGPAGGTFLFFGGKVKLEVPPGALTKTIPIGVLIPKSYPQAPRLVPGTVYDLLPDGVTFKKPVKLSITYDQKKVPRARQRQCCAFTRWWLEGGAWFRAAAWTPPQT